MKTFVFGVLVLLTGCDFQVENRPSVLVIAVEGLGFETFNCESDQLQERDRAGFKVFCEESVRFTHAFAPSTMSQASLASILTGQHPMDHRVRNNGSHFLSATVETLPEVAVSKGYRTLFVSGGPPIWRKSGLSQGFEVFDDNVEVSPGRYFRSVKDVTQIFAGWLKKEVEKSPFVSFLFLADLQFGAFATRSADGEPRERSRVGQLAQIGESLDQLVGILKKSKRWHNTTVVLVGLNGFHPNENVDSEPATLSLKSQNVQVAMYVKPARKERDGVQQWTIDKSVSLVDLGWTLFTMLGGEPKPSRWPQIQPVSLSMAFQAPMASWSESRLILSESAWQQWLVGGEPRWSIRQNQFLYIHDLVPQIYNTLTDRFETIGVAQNDPLWSSLNQDVKSFIGEAQLLPWQNLDTGWRERIVAARTIWNSTAQSSPTPSRHNSFNQWSARIALRDEQWADLAALGERAQEELWSYVGKSNLSGRVPLPKNPCLRTFVTGMGIRPVDCADDSVMALWDWIKAESEDVRGSARDKFLRLYLNAWMSDQIGILNFHNDLRWDVPRRHPGGPSTVDLILGLKAYEPFRHKLQLALGNIDVRF